MLFFQSNKEFLMSCHFIQMSVILFVMFWDLWFGVRALTCNIKIALGT